MFFGRGPWEQQGKESEVKRPLEYTALEVLIYVVGILVLLWEMLLVGRWLGFLVVMGALLWAGDSVLLYKQFPFVRINTHDQRAGSVTLKYWLALGVTLSIMGLTGVWFPLEWRWYLWWQWPQVTTWTWLYTPFFDLQITNSLFLVRVLLVLTPLVLWRPAVILRWVLDWERVLPNARNAAVSRIDLTGTKTPLGILSAQKQDPLTAEATPITGWAKLKEAAQDVEV